MLSLSVCLNALSLHGTCTAVFVAVAAVAAGLIASIQTLGKIKFIGWAGVVSIFAALLVLVIACGIQDRPAEAPPTGDWDKGLVIFGSPKFSEACAAVSGIVLSFAGAPTYFPMVAEMRDQRLFTRAVFVSQGIVIAVYMVSYYSVSGTMSDSRSSEPLSTSLSVNTSLRQRWVAPVF